eukprot:6433148-Prymnesium_polylepis.1
MSSRTRPSICAHRRRQRRAVNAPRGGTPPAARFLCFGRRVRAWGLRGPAPVRAALFYRCVVGSGLAR